MRLHAARLALVLPVLVIGLRLCAANPPPPAGSFTDDRGVNHAVPARKLRLISLIPALTESLFYLGHGGDLVAVSSFCNHPEAARALPKIGGPFDPNYEKILALRPDFILVMEIIPAAVLAKLEKLKLPVIFFKEPKSLDLVGAQLRRLEMIFASGERADGNNCASHAAVMAAFASELGQLIAPPAASGPACLLISPGQPLWIAGAGTFLDDFLKTSGCNNAGAAFEGWAAIELEKVAALNPDWIIFIGKKSAPNGPLAALIKARRIKTIALDEDMLSRPGPRILVPLKELETALGTLPAFPAASRPASPSSPSPHAP